MDFFYTPVEQIADLVLGEADAYFVFLHVTQNNTLSETWAQWLVWYFTKIGLNATWIIRQSSNHVFEPTCKLKYFLTEKKSPFK